jgi:hypothetical protein
MTLREFARRAAAVLAFSLLGGAACAQATYQWVTAAAPPANSTLSPDQQPVCRFVQADGALYAGWWDGQGCVSYDRRVVRSNGEIQFLATVQGTPGWVPSKSSTPDGRVCPMGMVCPSTIANPVSAGRSSGANGFVCDSGNQVGQVMTDPTGIPRCVVNPHCLRLTTAPLLLAGRVTGATPLPKQGSGVDPIIATPSAMDIARRYAPQVVLHPDEQWFPSSVAEYAKSMHLVAGDGTVISEDIFDAATRGNATTFLSTKVGFGDPYGTQPFMAGQDPTTTSVPVYAFIYQDPKDTGRFNVGPNPTIIVQYTMFFPYNYGKNVCMGPAPNDNCVGTRYIIGDHVGDWEVVTIRFIDGVPVAIHVGAHDNEEQGERSASTYHWSNGWVSAQGQRLATTSDGHPIVYAAAGSHGIWPTADRHTYQSLSTGDQLNDYTGQGKVWQTWNNVVAADDPALKGILTSYPGRWGNPHQGKSVCDLAMFGSGSACDSLGIPGDEYQMDDGPNLPLQRDRAYVLAAPTAACY